VVGSHVCDFFQIPRAKIAGFVIDTKSFFTEVLQAKIEQAAGEKFLLGVFWTTGTTNVISTSPVEQFGNCVK